MKIVLVTHNKNKAVELQELLKDTDVEPVPDSFVMPAETGASFEENATIKASAGASFFPDQWVAADDSGLEVDALGGAPGVHSARFAGDGSTDEENNAKLLEMLEQNASSDSARTARFRCCLVAFSPEGKKYTAFGTVEGTIADTPDGTNGFGYDPIFIPEGHTSTFGVLAPQIKSAMSHRSEAARNLSKALTNG